MDKEDSLELMVALLQDKTELIDRLKGEIESINNGVSEDKNKNLREQIKQLELHIQEIDNWYRKKDKKESGQSILNIPKKNVNKIMRRIVELRCLEGKSNKDVADELGIGIELVYSTTANIRKYGKESLKALGFKGSEIKTVLEFVNRHPRTYGRRKKA